MKKWALGTNDYFYTGGIYLEEAKWYIFMIGFITEFICDHFPSISLPSFIYTYSTDGEKLSLKEYYGTTKDLFHIYVCTPISIWCYKKTKCVHVCLPYGMLKEKFPVEVAGLENKFDEIEVKDNLKYSEEVEIEFRKIYTKVENIVKERLNKEDD